VTATTLLRQPVECTITVDGREIGELYPYLREVQVDTSRHAAASCSLVFDSLRKENGSWQVHDSGTFAPWGRIRIDARFGSRVEEVMRGFVRDIHVDCPEDMSSARVTVSGQDESLQLDRQHARRTWSTEQAPMSDGQIAQQIAADHGLAAQADPGLTLTSLAQDATPIRFLQDRAQANGFELLVRAGILHFHAPQLGGAAQPTIRVYAGDATNCLRIAVRHDGHMPDRVRMIRAAEQGTGRDDVTLAPDLPLLGKTAADSAGAGLGDFVWTMARPLGATAAEAQARAQAKANENAWKLSADGELDGALYGHVLLTHETVSVDGVGETYGGVYYVDEVRHVFSAEGYRQTFKLLRNALGEQAGGAGADPLAMVRG
jgi:phage protein D